MYFRIWFVTSVSILARSHSSAIFVASASLPPPTYLNIEHYIPESCPIRSVSAVKMHTYIDLIM